ncbi:hypothetical protein AC623_10175 [Bacillus sp. FJAT-27231]|nr:methyl-accepting chemotaxis protein [Bacillus sp. FJAT-27231]KMY54253.1 hypothetical protein AC623_10175 [Bacillus sp. FJAT-27231]
MSWLKNAHIAKKIITLIATSLLFIIAVGGFGYYNMSQMADRSNTLYQDRLLPIKWINDLRAQTRANEALVKEYILVKDQQKEQAILDEIQKRYKNIEKDLSLYKKTNLMDYETERLPQIDEELKQIQEKRQQLYALKAKSGPDAAFRYYEQNLKQLLNDLNVTLQELADYNASSAEKLVNEINSKEKTTSIFMVIVILASAVIALMLGLTISRIITAPMKDMVEKMAKAKEGDLAVQSDYQSKDEIGELVQSFNQMIAGMRTAIAEVNESASNLAANAEEISASTEEVATGTQQQAHDAGTSADMVTEMATAVQAVSRNTEDAANLSEKTLEAAQDGEKVINETITGMEQINASIQDLADKSVQIGEIIEVIDDIAEQTNLLALNAAIEAARAGEAGKGFAVVADEVRKLAERSGTATKEISELIVTIQENTKRSVEAVDSGNDKAVQAGETFGTILSLVKENASKVIEIASASEEQAAQAQEVLLSVQNIAAVSEEAAASVQETASTAADLASMAESLNHLAAKFKI